MGLLLRCYFHSHYLVLDSTIATYLRLIANEPAERRLFSAASPAEQRRSASEAAENSAARRIAYAKKFSIGL